MQYVRSISGSVSKTWNSINPATLSGAIDVIVVENEDGEPDLCMRSYIMSRLTDYLRRNTRMFSVPRPLRQVLFTSAFREKGTKDAHIRAGGQQAHHPT